MGMIRIETSAPTAERLWTRWEMGYRPEYIPIYYYYPKPKESEEKDESTIGQLKVDVSIKKPTKRWDTCGLTEDSVLVDTGARGEKVEKGEEE